MCFFGHFLRFLRGRGVAERQKRQPVRPTVLHSTHTQRHVHPIQYLHKIQGGTTRPRSARPPAPLGCHPSNRPLRTHRWNLPQVPPRFHPRFHPGSTHTLYRILQYYSIQSTISIHLRVEGGTYNYILGGRIPKKKSFHRTFPGNGFFIPPSSHRL